MAIASLAHVSVRTTDLESSRRFYIAVLGLREGFRPHFEFPGAWLYDGDDESGYGVVHLIGVDRDERSGLAEYLGDDARRAAGSGVIDHLAFLASGLADMHRRLKTARIPFRERTVPGLGLHQLFFEDPSKVTIELNFPATEATQEFVARPGA